MSVDELDELKFLAWEERVQAFSARFPLRREVTCRSALKTEHGKHFVQVRKVGGQALCQLTQSTCSHYTKAIRPLLYLARKGATRAELRDLKQHDCFFQLCVKGGCLSSL